MKKYDCSINSCAFLFAFFCFFLLGGCIPQISQNFPSSTSSAPTPAPIPMEFVLIPAGSFTMGTDPGFESGNQMPQHMITQIEVRSMEFTVFSNHQNFVSSVKFT